MDRRIDYYNNCPKTIKDTIGRTWKSDKEPMSACIRWRTYNLPDVVEVMCTPFFECECVPLQVMIEGGRNSFESNQKMLLDKKRLYEVQIQTFPSGAVARFLGFPKIELAKYDIVTSDSTQDAFKAKKAKEIQLR